MTIAERRQLFEMGLLAQRPERQRMRLAHDVKALTAGLAAQKRLEWESFHRTRVPTPASGGGVAPSPPATQLSPSARQPPSAGRHASPALGRVRASSNSALRAPVPAIDAAAGARIGTATSSPHRDSRHETAAVISPGTVQQKKTAYQQAASKASPSSLSRGGAITERTPLLGADAETGAANGTQKDRSCDCILL